MKRTDQSNASTSASDYGSQDCTHRECAGQATSNDVCDEAQPNSEPHFTETSDQAVRSLINNEGSIVSVQRLKALLGFKTDEALNRVIQSDRFALSTFRFSEETGLFALTAEVGWYLQDGKRPGPPKLQLAIKGVSDMSE